VAAESEREKHGTMPSENKKKLFPRHSPKTMLIDGDAEEVKVGVEAEDSGKAFLETPRWLWVSKSDD
jgi:hypothetical protein